MQIQYAYPSCSADLKGRGDGRKVILRSNAARLARIGLTEFLLGHVVDRLIVVSARDDVVLPE